MPKDDIEPELETMTNNGCYFYCFSLSHGFVLLIFQKTLGHGGKKSQRNHFSPFQRSP